MNITDRSLLETLRELVVVRNHNLAFGPKDDQATLLMMAEGSLVLVGLERFLRVTLGSEATDTDTLPNLLEKATGDRLKLLTLPADDRSLAVSQIKSVRNRVTAGEGGSHFQRHHRYPGTHPVARRRYSAVPLAYGRAARLRGNSGIDLLLPGEADGGFVADRRHLDVGWYQSRHHPPSRTINQSFKSAQS